MWKTDLVRAYRQLRSDPLDYPLMAIIHRGSHYIDICIFRCRGSSAAQQRVSLAGFHLIALQGYSTLAYINNFCWAHSDFCEAVRSFAACVSLCDTLGLKIAPKNPHFLQLAWSGLFHFDTVKMETTIPEAKLREVLNLMD